MSSRRRQEAERKINALPTGKARAPSPPPYVGGYTKLDLRQSQQYIP